MEAQCRIQEEGDEARLDDWNKMGESAGLADDRVLWELLRTPPNGTLVKGIIPFATAGARPLATLTSAALISGNVADGRIRVSPFRAVVSSVSSVNTLESLRGMRSGYCTGNSTPYSTLSVSPNANANPRWSVVYCQVKIDTPAGAPEPRYNKSPTSDVISSTPRTPILMTKVVVGIVDGSPAATPTRPPIPSDDLVNGIFYIQLGAVLVPGGFGVLSTVLRSSIEETAPVLSLHSATGASSCGVANQNSLPGGVVDVRQNGSGGALRPGAYLPSTMAGEDVLRVLIQLTLAPVSHNDSDVIDSSRDWRWRYFDWSISATPGTTAANAFASDRRLSAASPSPSAPASQVGLNYTVGAGQSFDDDTAQGAAFSPGITDGHGAAVYTHGGRLTGVSTGGGAADAFMIYVRSTDGALVLRKTAGAGGQVYVTIRASGPMPNHGTY